MAIEEIIEDREVRGQEKSPFLIYDPSEEEKKLFLEHYRSEIDNHYWTFEEAIKSLFAYAILVVVWEWDSTILRVGTIIKSSDSDNWEHYVEVHTEKWIRKIILTLQVFDLCCDWENEVRASIWYREIAEDWCEYEDDIVIDDKKLKTWNIVQSIISKQRKILLENNNQKTWTIH